jgi:hypothetical protein
VRDHRIGRHPVANRSACTSTFMNAHDPSRHISSVRFALSVLSRGEELCCFCAKGARSSLAYRARPSPRSRWLDEKESAAGPWGQIRGQIGGQVDPTESNSNGSTEPNQDPEVPDLPGCGPGGRGFESRRSPSSSSLQIAGFRASSEPPFSAAGTDARATTAGTRGEEAGDEPPLDHTGMRRPPARDAAYRPTHTERASEERRFRRRAAVSTAAPNRRPKQASPTPERDARSWRRTSMSISSLSQTVPQCAELGTAPYQERDLLGGR